MTGTERLIVAAFAAMILLSHAWPAASQPVCANPANLTTNCGFDGGISSWDFLIGPPSWDAVNGHDAAGCASVASELIEGQEVRVEQCVSTGVVAGTTYGVGAFVRVTTGVPIAAGVEVIEFSSADCLSGFLGPGGATMIESFPDTWNRISTTFTTAATTGSVLLSVAAYSETPYTVCFDDIFLGQDLTPVVLQSLDVD